MKRLVALLALGAACVTVSGGGGDPGRRLFLAKCTACHAAPDPGAHSEAEWASLVREYGAEANCSEEEILLILDYLRRANTDPASEQGRGSAR